MPQDLYSPEYEPLPKTGAVNRLIESRSYAHGRAADGLFARAMREASELHYKNCPEFGGLWRQSGFKPSDIKSFADLKRMPFIFVSAFKERSLVSIPARKIQLELTSSGTGGQKSRIILDELSLKRVRRIAWQVFSGLGMADKNETSDCLCFTYDPAVAKTLGTAFTDKLLTGLTKTGEVFYALKWSREKKEFYFDMDGAAAALERFEKRGNPARIIGFPAHALELCGYFMRKKGRAARLRPDSWVITGGGWKDKQDRAVDKTKMRRTLARMLGLHESRVRDLFGMVEHGVPYVDCPLGRFHIPVYGRIFVRHPATLELLPPGKTGLLQFITPYLSSYPSISLLSSDFGSVERGCACGLGGQIMNIAGRGGVKKLKGCAVSASALL